MRRTYVRDSETDCTTTPGIFYGPQICPQDSNNNDHEVGAGPSRNIFQAPICPTLSAHCSRIMATNGVSHSNGMRETKKFNSSRFIWGIIRQRLLALHIHDLDCNEMMESCKSVFDSGIK